MNERSESTRSPLAALAVLGGACIAALSLLFSIGRGPDLAAFILLAAALVGAVVATALFWPIVRADTPRRTSILKLHGAADSLLHYAELERGEMNRLIVTSNFDSMSRRVKRINLELMAQQLAAPYTVIRLESMLDRQRATDMGLWTASAWLLLDADEFRSSDLGPLLRRAGEGKTRAVVLADRTDPAQVKAIEGVLDQAGVVWSLITKDLVVRRAESEATR